MHIILKKRLVLVRSMVDAAADMPKMHPEIKPAEIAAIDKIVALIRQDDKKHFISLSLDTSTANISYCKAQDDKYNMPRRVMTPLGRYLTKHYAEERASISDAGLDKFVRRVGVHLNKASIALLEARIKTFRGKELRDKYRTTDAHSCMTGKCNSYKLNLYEINADKVALVELDGQIRALLWNCDDGIKVLDRAYPAGHNKIDQLRLWAESKGYILRSIADQNVPDGTIELNDKSKRKVTLKHSGCFPFLDTFRYGEFNGYTVTVSNDYEFGTAKFIRDQGTYEEVVRCIKCGSRKTRAREVLIGDEIDTVNICDECYAKTYFQCGQCGKNMSSRNMAINGAKHRNKKNYCSKCALTLQKYLQFNDCTCDHCLETKKLYKEVFQAAGLNVNDDIKVFSERNGDDNGRIQEQENQ